MHVLGDWISTELKQLQEATWCSTYNPSINDKVDVIILFRLSTNKICVFFTLKIIITSFTDIFEEVFSYESLRQALDISLQEFHLTIVVIVVVVKYFSVIIMIRRNSLLRVQECSRTGVPLIVYHSRLVWDNTWGVKWIITWQICQNSSYDTSPYTTEVTGLNNALLYYICPSPLTKSVANQPWENA